MTVPTEVQEFLDCEDRLFVCGVDTPPEVKRIRHEDYHGAWKRLLDAGYTPNQAETFRK